MKKMIAFCGLVCTECPAFTRAQESDEGRRKEIAESWQPKHVFQPEDTTCDGCLATEGRLIKFCEECEVRFCGFDKNVKNCAHCDEFPCEKLNELWKELKAPDAKANLEEIRKGF